MMLSLNIENELQTASQNTKIGFKILIKFKQVLNTISAGQLKNSK